MATEFIDGVYASGTFSASFNLSLSTGDLCGSLQISGVKDTTISIPIRCTIVPGADSGSINPTPPPGLVSIILSPTTTWPYDG